MDQIMNYKYLEATKEDLEELAEFEVEETPTSKVVSVLVIFIYNDNYLTLRFLYA